MSSPVSLHDEINKRHTLNLLIQGAAQHAFLTAHYIVADELNRISPELIPLYDSYAIGTYLSSWIGVNALIHGSPKRFWSQVPRPTHPFANHPVLSLHGRKLAMAAREHAESRAKTKGVRLTPVLFSLQLVNTTNRIFALEAMCIPQLEQLALEATAHIWDIESSRLDGRITRKVGFGHPRPAASRRARMLRGSAVGYGGVIRTEAGLIAVARGFTWPVLSHELVKAVTELICLHGLNRLDRVTYLQVLEAADRIEYEPWLQHAGSELWRRLLAVHPCNAKLAYTLMQIARLPPDQLQSLMLSIVEQPNQARQTLALLGK